jgi:hypothetical protein
VWRRAAEAAVLPPISTEALITGDARADIVVRTDAAEQRTWRGEGVVSCGAAPLAYVSPQRMLAALLTSRCRASSPVASRGAERDVARTRSHTRQPYGCTRNSRLNALRGATRKVTPLMRVPSRAGTVSTVWRIYEVTLAKA